MLIPRINIQRTMGKQILTNGQMELPEEYMDQYKKIAGDGQARITVSADMALKDFGSGAGAMVSVSLSCGQDKESIEAAVDMAGQLARVYCVEQHNQTMTEWQALQQKAQAQTGKQW